MTLIVAWRCDDEILIGGDSQVTEEDIITTEESKVFCDHSRVCWGWSGDRGLSHEWGDWFRTEPETWASWTELRDRAAHELARLNGQRRGLKKLSGVEAKPGELSNVLLAGYVSGKPDILELDENGNATFLGDTKDKFGTIGSGAIPYKFTFLAAMMLTHRTMPFNAGNFISLMNVAVAIAATGCSLPLTGFRITADGSQTLFNPNQAPSPDPTPPAP
jgi:20S proteasome alpha/beta subunit